MLTITSRDGEGLNDRPITKSDELPAYPAGKLAGRGDSSQASDIAGSESNLPGGGGGRAPHGALRQEEGEGRPRRLDQKVVEMEIVQKEDSSDSQHEGKHSSRNGGGKNHDSGNSRKKHKSNQESYTATKRKNSKSSWSDHSTDDSGGGGGGMEGMTNFMLDGKAESFMPINVMRGYLNGLVDATAADTKNQVKI